MKIFKIIALSLTSLAIVIPAETIAKEGKKFHKHDSDRNGRVQHFIDDIDLDESQKKSIKNLNEQYRLKANEVKNDKSLSKEERKDALKELRDEKRDNLDKILTQEQLEKMTEIREKHNQKKAEREKMTPSEKSRKITDRMTKHLELDDEQQNSVYEINKKYITLFDDAKSQGYNKEAIMDIRFRQKAEISEVLSEEQKKKLNARHPRR